MRVSWDIVQALEVRWQANRTSGFKPTTEFFMQVNSLRRVSQAAT